MPTMKSRRAIARGRSPLLLLALAAPIVAHRSAADPPPESFVWERGEGAETCPSEDAVRQKIIEMTGYDPFTDPTAPRARVTVRMDGGRLVATVRVVSAPDDRESTRELESPPGDCAPIADAVALAIALAMDDRPRRSPPSAGPGSADGAADVPPSAGSMGATAAMPSAERSVSPEVADGPRGWGVRAEAIWTLGLLPRPNTGFGLGLRRGWGDRFQLVAGGVWLPAQSEAGQFSAGLAAAKAGACVEAPRFGPLAAEHCALAFVGAWRLAPEAGTLASKTGPFWSAGALSSALALRSRDGIEAELGAMGLVPFARPTFQTASCPPAAFQQPAVALALFFSAGLSIR